MGVGEAIVNTCPFAGMASVLQDAALRIFSHPIYFASLVCWW